MTTTAASRVAKMARPNPGRLMVPSLEPLAQARQLEQMTQVVEHRLAGYPGRVAQYQVAQRIDDPQPGAGAEGGMAGSVQSQPAQLWIFPGQAGGIVGVRAGAQGQGMARAARLAAQADMDLPGQIDQLAAIRRATVGGGPHESPAAPGLAGHAELGEGLPVAMQLAVEGAPLRHPESPLVHGAGQQHGTEHPQQDEQQLQPPPSARSDLMFKMQRWMHREPPVPGGFPDR